MRWGYMGTRHMIVHILASVKAIISNCAQYVTCHSHSHINGTFWQSGQNVNLIDSIFEVDRVIGSKLKTKMGGGVFHSLHSITCSRSPTSSRVSCQFDELGSFPIEVTHSFDLSHSQLCDDSMTLSMRLYMLTTPAGIEITSVP